MRTTLAACAALAAAGVGGAVLAGDTVTIDLAGVKIEDGSDQSRDSRPAALAPATKYFYQVDGMVKGTSGLLAAFFSDPTPLSEVLETVQAGSSGLLQGYRCNGAGTHPFTLMEERFEGEVDLGFTTADMGVTVTAKIDGSDIAGFTLTDVVISPSFLVGAMQFTSGTVTITRIACPADYNGDGKLNINDFIAYQSSFQRGEARADFNCDGSLNINDFITFQAAWRKGC